MLIFIINDRSSLMGNSSPRLVEVPTNNPPQTPKQAIKLPVFEETDWKDLKVACPAQNCPADKSKTNFWQHASCGAKIQINCKAYLRCLTHNSPYSILDAKWACENHSADFRLADKKGLFHSMMIASSMYSQEGHSVWVESLMNEIAELGSSPK